MITSGGAGRHVGLLGGLLAFKDLTKADTWMPVVPMGWAWIAPLTLILRPSWGRAVGPGAAPLTACPADVGVLSLQVTVCWVDEARARPTHCLSPQAEHAGVRTYFFSAESPEEQEAWIQAMGEAARVQIPPAQKSVSQPVRHK